VGKTLSDKINGWSGIITICFSIVGTFFCGLALWVISSTHDDIGDLRKSFNLMKDNMVYKCDYVEDYALVTKVLMKIDDRVREVEKQ